MQQLNSVFWKVTGCFGVTGKTLSFTPFSTLELVTSVLTCNLNYLLCIVYRGKQHIWLQGYKVTDVFCMYMDIYQKILSIYRGNLLNNRFIK